MNLLPHFRLELCGFFLLVVQLSVYAFIGHGLLPVGRLSIWSFGQTARTCVLGQSVKSGIELLAEAVAHLLQVADFDPGFQADAAVVRFCACDPYRHLVVITRFVINATKNISRCKLAFLTFGSGHTQITGYHEYALGGIQCGWRCLIAGRPDLGGLSFRLFSVELTLDFHVDHLSYLVGRQLSCGGGSTATFWGGTCSPAGWGSVS